MRKLVVSEFVTVDGVMEDPGGAEKFRHGGWTRPYWNEEIGKYKFDELFASDALLIGRVTYQGFAAAWPSMTDEAGFADRMNNLPKYVVSKTLNEVNWKNSKLIKDNIAEEVSKLKQQPGRDILIFGSAALVQSLMRHDLIDEYQLLVYPVTLGSGKRLFRDRSNLKLVGTKTFSSGVVALHYRPERTPPHKSR
ncbi:MAG TPA: dihydrofolate reductase family protein [Candidatus Bathyarchaeia archaeon]|nr:dihydrofolate reductase family protein [Candidatus Bathyarchaeia archaeon]